MRKLGWNRGAISPEELGDMVKASFSHLWLDEYWVIVWIGRVFRNHNSDVLFEALIGRIKERDELTSFNLDRIDTQELKTVNLPLRLMKILPPGTIVQGGIVLFGRHRKYFKKQRVIVDPSSSNVIHFDEWSHFQEVSNKLIGANERQLPFKWGDTKVIVCNYNRRIDDSYYDHVVFQTAELARYYWFRSTRLTQCFVEPSSISKHRNKLFVPDSLRYPTTAEPYHQLLVRDEMYLRDSPTIARLAFDETAARSALLISKSIINRNVERGTNSSFYLESTFPFTQPAELKVFGIEINHGEKRTLLVLEIHDCGGKYPYEGLRYHRESLDRKVNKGLDPKGFKKGYEDDDIDPEDELQKGYTSKYAPYFDEEPTKDSKQKNDNRVKNLEMVDRSTRNSGMPKDIAKMDRIKDAPPKHNKKEQSRNIKNISTSDNKTGTSQSTGVDVTSETNDQEKRHPEQSENINILIKQIGSEFEKLEAEVRYFDGSKTFGGADFVYLTISEDARDSILEENYCSIFRNGQKRRRRMIMMGLHYVDIDSGVNLNFMLCEIEPKSNSSMKVFVKNKKHTKFDGSPMNLNDVDSILKALIEDNGGLEMLPDIYQSFRFYHNSENAGHYVKRILDKLIVNDQPELLY
jgi:hypothetical protein